VLSSYGMLGVNVWKRYIIIPVGCGQPPSVRKTINSWLLAATEQYAGYWWCLRTLQAILEGVPLVHKVILASGSDQSCQYRWMPFRWHRFVWTIAFSPQDSQLLVSGSSDGTVTSGTGVPNIQEHTGGVKSVDFSPQGDSLLAVMTPQWRWITGKCHRSLPGTPVR